MNLSDNEFAAEMAAAQESIETRDMAFAIADAFCAECIETMHYTVVVDGKEWRDLRMLHNADYRDAAERSTLYLTRRKRLLRHAAFPNLVRVARPEPAPAAGETPA